MSVNHSDYVRESMGSCPQSDGTMYVKWSLVGVLLHWSGIGNRLIKQAFMVKSRTFLWSTGVILLVESDDKIWNIFVITLSSLLLVTFIALYINELSPKVTDDDEIWVSNSLIKAKKYIILIAVTEKNKYFLRCLIVIYWWLNFDSEKGMLC